jgi:hypothetical protein
MKDAMNRGICLKIMENYYGQSSMQAQKALTRWVAFDDLYREVYKEAPLYSFD